MMLNVELPPVVEDRLRSEAERLGVPRDTLAARLLENGLPEPELSPEEKKVKLLALLKQWEEEAELMTEEEEESNEDLFRAIDSHRPHRRLFDRP
jgi:hypothetical protein